MNSLRDLSFRIRFLRPGADAAERLERLVKQSIEEIRNVQVCGNAQAVQTKHTTLQLLQYNIRQSIQAYRMKAEAEPVEDMELRWARQDAYRHISQFLNASGMR